MKGEGKWNKLRTHWKVFLDVIANLWQSNFELWPPGLQQLFSLFFHTLNVSKFKLGLWLWRHSWHAQRINSVHWPGSKSRCPRGRFCLRAAGPGSASRAPGSQGRISLCSVLVRRLPGSDSVSQLHTCDCLWPSYQGEFSPWSPFTLLPPLLSTGFSSITCDVRIAHTMLCLRWNSMDLKVAGKDSAQGLATVYLKEAEAEWVAPSLPMAAGLNIEILWNKSAQRLEKNKKQKYLQISTDR